MAGWVRKEGAGACGRLDEKLSYEASMTYVCLRDILLHDMIACLCLCACVCVCVCACACPHDGLSCAPHFAPADPSGGLPPPTPRQQQWRPPRPRPPRGPPGGSSRRARYSPLPRTQPGPASHSGSSR